MFRVLTANRSHYLESEAGGLSQLSPQMPNSLKNNPCVTVLPGSEKIHHSGGKVVHNVIVETHVYDFSASTWTRGPDMLVQRDKHACAALTMANGTTLVVLAGGSSNGFCKS